MVKAQVVTSRTEKFPDFDIAASDATVQCQTWAEQRCPSPARGCRSRRLPGSVSGWRAERSIRLSQPSLRRPNLTRFRLASNASDKVAEFKLIPCISRNQHFHAEIWFMLSCVLAQ